MNRYSQITTSEFNPLSFQEIMAAPLMQRQKHDQLIAQQEMLKQGLAKTNPHDKYFDEAVRLKDELNNQITSQAELLAKEGVNSNSQADFLKLNRNYQETMSPTGKLGMINAHNVNLQSTYKNYIDEAIKAGQSPAIAKLHADQAIQKHMQQPLYDERGRIVDFSAGNAAPKYIDNVKWINELASKVGFTQSNWAQASSGMSKNADGRFVVNESAKGMTKDNIENLNRLAQAANKEVLDPASEIRQNIDYNFKNPQTELDGMLNQLYARREREDGVTDRNKSYGSVDWNENSGVSGNMELIVNNEVFKPNSLATNTFIDNKNRLSTLQTKSNLTPEERTELNGLKDFQSNVTKELTGNREYQVAKNQQNNFYKNYSHNVQTLLKDPSLRSTAEFQSSKTSGIFNVKTQSGEILKGGDGKVLNFTQKQMSEYYSNRNKASDADKKVLNIQNKVTNENSVKYNGYQLVPITPKDDTSIKLANDAFENALRANPENLLNLTNIESVDVEGGRREGKDLDLTDKKAIQQLFNGSERGNLKIVSFIPKGFSGKPEYIVEFNTKEGNSTNLNRYGRFGEKGSGNLGNGKPVRLKLSYKQTKGDVLNNANGYIQQYLSDKGSVNPNTGQPIGRDLALDMKVNADKAVLNDQLSNSKWSSVVTENTDFNKLNPFIVKQLQSELKRYGLTNDTTDQELQTIVKKFIKENSNKNIYLE